jgi:hypothetical protein
VQVAHSLFAQPGVDVYFVALYIPMVVGYMWWVDDSGYGIVRYGLGCLALLGV